MSDDETEIVSACRYCWEQFGEIVRIVPVAHGNGSGHWECAKCKATCGVWLNTGTLDLGVMAEEP